MSTQNYIGFASVNGVITKLEDARIELIDRGLLFGHALFETLFVRNGHINQWKKHYLRLKHSCQKVLIQCPLEDDLKTRCENLLQKMQSKTPPSQSLSLKIIVTGGSESKLFTFSNELKALNSNIYIICETAQMLSNEQRLAGFKVKSFLDERGTVLKELKSVDYLFNFLTLRSAKIEGYEDVLLRNEDGFITEGVTSSFLWFDNDYSICFTPPKGNCLAGTTVMALISKLKEHNISFKYQMLNKNEATNCVGCAMVSSIRGLVPIRQIDDIKFDIYRHIDFYHTLIEMLDSCA